MQSTMTDSNLSLHQCYLHIQGSFTQHPGEWGQELNFTFPRDAAAMLHKQHPSIDFSSIDCPIRIHAIETSCQADRGADRGWTAELLCTEKSISMCFHNMKNRWRATQGSWKCGPGVFPEQTALTTLSLGVHGILEVRSDADN